MEKAEQELLLQTVPNNPELKKLLSEHRKLEKDVAKFELFRTYSPSAALHQQSLKKQKLHAKDKITQILRKYQAQAC